MKASALVKEGEFFGLTRNRILPGEYNGERVMAIVTSKLGDISYECESENFGVVFLPGSKLPFAGPISPPTSWLSVTVDFSFFVVSLWNSSF